MEFHYQGCGEACRLISGEVEARILERISSTTDVRRSRTLICALGIIVGDLFLGALRPETVRALVDLARSDIDVIRTRAREVLDEDVLRVDRYRPFLSPELRAAVAEVLSGTR